MSNLVIVRKTAFGTPAFMFLRTSINILMRERDKLNPKFTDNEVRYRWLCNTIRAMAGLVYFLPKQRRAVEARVAPAPKPIQLTEKQKQELKRLKLLETQKELF